MARPWIVLVAALVLVGGCQSNKHVSIPPPNFAGPTIAPRPAPAPPTITRTPPRPTPTVPAQWTPRAPVRSWRWIVIHHSATPAGSMAEFDRMHRAKGWDGIGYHFVIGNGSSSGDGQVEVTPRWTAQKWGAHAKTPDNRYNDFGIGICLVGNFDVDRPTAAQMRGLTALVWHLMGTYHISPDNVIGHRDAKPTECPGRHMNVASLRRTVSGLSLFPDVSPDLAEAPVNAGELLQLSQLVD